MELSPSAIADLAAQNSSSQQAQEVQITMLKKAIDTQASGAAALLMALANPLPLASSGMLGTRVNTLA